PRSLGWRLFHRSIGGRPCDLERASASGSLARRNLWSTRGPLYRPFLECQSRMSKDVRTLVTLMLVATSAAGPAHQRLLATGFGLRATGVRAHLHRVHPPPASAAPAGYVRPFVGTARYGYTFPGATVPFGMVQWSPDT